MGSGGDGTVQVGHYTSDIVARIRIEDNNRFKVLQWSCTAGYCESTLPYIVGTELRFSSDNHVRAPFSFSFSQSNYFSLSFMG